MSNFADLVNSLKRAVAPPGEFDTVYPEATTSQLKAALADGFAEAQLDRFFADVPYTLDLTAYTVTPDLTPAQGSLVVIYSAATLVSARLLNLKTVQRYNAGKASVELETAASILTTLLKQFNDRKVELRTIAQYVSSAAAFAMADGYVMAATGSYWLPGNYGPGNYQPGWA